MFNNVSKICQTLQNITTCLPSTLMQLKANQSFTKRDFGCRSIFCCGRGLDHSQWRTPRSKGSWSLLWRPNNVQQILSLWQKFMLWETRKVNKIQLNPQACNWVIHNLLLCYTLVVVLCAVALMLELAGMSLLHFICKKNIREIFLFHVFILFWVKLPT